MLTERLYKELAPRGFQPLDCAVNDMSKLLVGDYIRKYGLTYPVGYSLRSPMHVFLQQPENVQLFYPNMVFIDRKGVVRAQYMGNEPFYNDMEKNVRATLEGLLKESASAAPAKAARK